MEKKFNWENDFKSFIEGGASSVPQVLTNNLKQMIYRELNPAPLLVLLKLCVVVIFSGSITLSFCPQFGFGSMEHSGIFAWFMKYGPKFCHLACGALFSGTGVIVATLIFKIEELRTIARTKLLQFSALSAIALGIFICLGAEAFSILGLFWFLGAIGFSFLSFELGYNLRLRLR